MLTPEVYDHEAISVRLRHLTEAQEIRVTVHGHQEMVEEDISLGEVMDVLINASILENYPEHKRGPCCLACGKSSRGRYIHVVCTTSLELVVIITVYEPKPPKWPTPFERGKTK